MSTTVTFAGHVTGDPELLHTLDGEPFVACRVVVNRLIQTEAGEWVDGENTGHNVTIYGTAAEHFYDSAGRGDRVVVHGQLRSEAWRDGETGEKRAKQVVTVDNRSGEVGRSLKYGAGRLERQTALAATTEN